LLHGLSAAAKSLPYLSHACAFPPHCNSRFELPFRDAWVYISANVFPLHGIEQVNVPREGRHVLSLPQLVAHFGAMSVVA